MSASRKPRILVFAGSTRRGSFNKMLARVAVSALRGAGADVTHVDLNDYPMPLYDGDDEDEQGVPENARKLRRLMQEQDGFLIVSPEYNSSVTGVLKNSIDWTSRPDGKTEYLEAYEGKFAALLSASPGRLGGMRALGHLREILQNIGVTIVPETFSLSRAAEAFDAEGALKDSKIKGRVEEVAHELVGLLQRIVTTRATRVH